MTRLRFALLNAAHDGANTRRNFRRELDADLVEFDAVAGDLPDHTEFDGVVVTGSRSSVYWDEAWIPPLVDYVAEAADAGVPVLGVCYGHQVLAEALGGRVAGMDGFEIGYNEIRRPRDDPLFEGIDETFTAFTTHGDAVVELPPSATLLAENDRGVHAFRDGHCWGVQFHPEYDIDTARDVTDGKRDQIGDARVDGVLESITPDAYDAACEAKQLFENFTGYAERLAAERAERAAADD
ncbi:type 1 glutamine amidotransferase [Halorubrum ezzemoulense]|jgi:GMP synthase (glutamine-hydrolysing)|uniref:GMP synthase (Glutamine-hydrolysing) n=2 Tax=Halorubrum ezzemoulense TaxID=337243 RepID=A0A256JYY3_HALEZ|nr:MULTISPECIES: type 1 glutamine amidotransferase [Halorubrum]MDB2236593.1 type 1 glutamine amidotransferase [Halorubrum ezzemoulense]MDB2241050.1 type 1 glutamine amidotransferase [Halorubrum ezzemoulense]MDB2248119.1 type 1 glutamine amidotransferase [Halorubrum ezzemoulense]MDB2263263.1 type 1 glutamine amidotransferase [Halorubrum ezzemoulense]MDB2273518.1 type 1 glutamine amidotransferase [Halorubrum ezzemoulense]